MNIAARLVDVEKTYKVGNLEVPAVRGVSLDIEAGAFLAMVGPSGSGKTTLLNLIGALDTPTAGNIWIGDSATAGLSPRDLADFRNSHLGFVFQSFNLIPVLTAMENVTLPMIFAGVDRDERSRRGREILESVGLGERLDHKPAELSGGQQQRVAIARALANNPVIVLADEPTGNLDSKTGNIVIEFLERMHKKEGKTIIMVTHDEYVSKAADRIEFLKDGQIVNCKGKC